MVNWWKEEESELLVVVFVLPVPKLELVVVTFVLVVVRLAAELDGTAELSNPVIGRVDEFKFTLVVEVSLSVVKAVELVVLLLAD